jgi:hypothetical protein
MAKNSMSSGAIREATRRLDRTIASNQKYLSEWRSERFGESKSQTKSSGTGKFVAANEPKAPQRP